MPPVDAIPRDASNMLPPIAAAELEMFSFALMSVATPAGQRTGAEEALVRPRLPRLTSFEHSATIRPRKGRCQVLYGVRRRMMLIADEMGIFLSGHTI